MAWPTTDEPRDVFVTGRLTQTEAADLDWFLARRGWSRSEALRTGLDEMIAREKKAAKRETRRANKGS